MPFHTTCGAFEKNRKSRRRRWTTSNRSI